MFDKHCSSVDRIFIQNGAVFQNQESILKLDMLVQVDNSATQEAETRESGVESKPWQTSSKTTQTTWDLVKIDDRQMDR